MVFFSSKEGVIIAPQSPFLGGKIRLQILQILFNQISLAHTHVTRSRERKNSEPGRSYTLDALRLRVAPLPPVLPCSVAIASQGCCFWWKGVFGFKNNSPIDPHSLPYNQF